MLGDNPATDPEELEETPSSQAPQSTFTQKRFGSEDVRMPYLALLQGMSPAVQSGEGQPGQFLVTGHEPVDEVTLVFAAFTNKRRYSPALGQSPQCQSPDAVKGYGNPGILCHECPLGQWTPTGKLYPDGRPMNQKPPCDLIDAWSCFSVTHGMPVTWELKGTAMTSSAFIKGLTNGLGYGHFALSISSERKEAPGRVWHQPKPRLSRDISLEECQVYYALALGETPSPGALAPGE